MNRSRGWPSALSALLGLLLLAGACAPSAPSAPAAKSDAPAVKTDAAPAKAEAPAAKTDAAPAKTEAAPAAAKPVSNDAQITIVHGMEPSTFDPADFAALPERSIVANMLEPLLDRDSNARIIPRLAASYRGVDPTTWEFKLRPNVKFHDGTAFNAQAVKTNFDRIKNPDTKSKNAGLFAAIKEVKAVDDTTLQIVTNGPSPTLPAVVITYPGMIVSPAALAKGPQFVAANPVGTGPYKLVEWTKDKQLIIERNPDYWGEKPQIAKATFRPVPELSTRVTLVKTGEADIAANLTPDQSQVLKNDQNVRVLTVPTGLIVVIEMWAREKDRAVGEPLLDKRFREAINIAIDRKSIVDGILDGAATPVGNPIPPQFPGYNDAVKPYPYDPARAKQLIQQGGWTGFSWTLTYPTGGRYVGDDKIAQLLQQNWEAIGLKTTLKPMEWAQFTATRNQRPPIGMGGWAGRGAFDPEFSLFPVYASGDDNQLVTGIPQLEAVLKQARQELDEAKRAELYKQAQQIIHDEYASLVLHQQHNVYAVRSRIDWSGRADEALFVSEMKVK